MLTKYDRRKFRVRNKIIANNKSCRPRVIIFRSNKNIYLQLVDVEGKVVSSFSTLNLPKDEKNSGIDKAKIVGREFARKCLKIGVEKVVFDKGVYTYGGKVKFLADSCRAEGLQF